jgi:hypothetical protein
LSATAFGSSRGPTIWNVSDCRPGASKASAIPPSAASDVDDRERRVSGERDDGEGDRDRHRGGLGAMTSLRDSMPVGDDACEADRRP